jgi:cytochrome c peroxidase
VNLTTHLYQVPTLRKSAAIPQFPHAFMACTETTLPFVVLLYKKYKYKSKGKIRPGSLSAREEVEV